MNHLRAERKRTGITARQQRRRRVAQVKARVSKAKWDKAIKEYYESTE